VPSFSQKCRRPVEDVGILSEEAEDQPSHEVVHVVTAIDGSPYRVVYQKFNIEPVQSANAAPDPSRKKAHGRQRASAMN
jgi:hypothetical protein